jgi:hypothetical protein
LGIGVTSWRLAFASAIGTSHVQTGIECQDYSLASVVNDGTLLACVADGAGSAKRSALGARIACETFAKLATEFVQSGQSIADIDRAFVCDRWLEHMRQEIVVKAADEGCDLREFATTFLGVVLCESHSLYVQVGDGAIVVNDSNMSEEYAVVFWPQHGEYANTTNFLTDTSAIIEVSFETVPTKAYRIAMFTDGLERLLLDLKNACAAVKTVEQLMAPLLADNSVDLSPSLGKWLQGKAVIDRTDDDKSLVLAARIP